MTTNMAGKDSPTVPTRIAPFGWITLLLAAATLRSGAIAARWDHLSRDPDAYRLIAENLVQRGVYSRAPSTMHPLPTAFRPPLYPLILAGTCWQGRVGPWNVAILHVVVGTLTVLLVLLLARVWQLGQWSWLAATLVACDPILLNQAGEVMTETLATLLAVVGLLGLTRLTAAFSWKSSILAGLALGLAVLCRPTFLVWAVLCGAYVLLRWRSWPSIKTTAVLVVVFLLVLLPWGLRNQRVIGRAILATTHGGYTLLLANNPLFYDHLRRQPWGSVWDAQALETLILQSEVEQPSSRPAEHPELSADRRLYQMAVETIRAHPTMFAYASLVRVARLWTPLPHQVSAGETPLARGLRWLVACWYLLMYAMAGLGLWQLRRRLLQTPWIWGLLARTGVDDGTRRLLEQHAHARTGHAGGLFGRGGLMGGKSVGAQYP